MTITDDPSADPAEDAATAEFRASVQAFLAQHCRPRRSRRAGQDEADVEEDATVLEPESLAQIGEAKAYQAALFDAGLAFLTWPRDKGGAGLTKRHQEIFLEEAAGYELPTAIYQIGHGMCAPTILEYGTDEQQQHFLPTLLRGEEIWCQLYSEPGAGSDVASLQTRAARDGDEWIVNGQKVWTSGAHYSQWGILIARTNLDAPKHKGITMFVLDMSTPGIEIRPLRQITGAANFNEVYFTDVRIPHANVLGTVDDGWRLSVSLLMNERIAIGSSGDSPRSGGYNPVLRLARRQGVTGDATVRQSLTELWIHERLMNWNGQRTRAALKAGKAPGPEGSLGKLHAAIFARKQGDIAIAIAGASGQAWAEGDERGMRWAHAVLSAPAYAIAGGTSEVQRNIIGERVLGLPKEPQVDRDLPFRELKVGTQRDPR